MFSLKKSFDFYLNSSIHVALGVVSLAVVTAVHSDIPLDYSLLCFVFFGTITGYNFVKYAGIAKLYHRSLAAHLRLIQIFSLLCFLALGYFSFQVNWKVLLAAAALGFITLLYALPVLSGQRNLRDVATLKVFVIAGIWAGVTVLFPIINAQMPFKPWLITEFCQRFLFVLILILPFEIRDLKYDRKRLKTLPQRLGVRRVKLFGYFLIGLWVLLEFFKAPSNFDSKSAIMCAAIFTGFTVFRSDENQSPYFASFWVEGIPVLWMLLLLFFRNL